MNLVKWDPFRELEEVPSRLNRLFGRSTLPAESDREMLSVADWMPSVDISETDNSYLVKAEIPGVNKDDVKVMIEDGMLTIQGERKQEQEENGKKYHRIERSYGCFMRSFRVPDDADDSAAKAEFKDGMLNITLNKTQKSRSNAVNVSIS
ncbi:MAG: Hsp20/alpha crystallin family protein [Gallionella sp.]|jgi:HSP20 family protein|nr:Hsp20/alpha crystallin family protein [Gallionella sp.]MCK9352976.1 Hsp20/alpha crystallin family protein [Gallionella sp.]